MAKEKSVRQKKPKKKIELKKKLVRIIAVTLFSAIAILVVSDAYLLNPLNMLQMGVRLWLASMSIESAAQDDPEHFMQKLTDVTDNYALYYTEIFNADGKLVYTSLYPEDIQPPFNELPVIDESYRRNLEVTEDSAPGDSGKYFIMYRSPQNEAEFIGLGSILPSGDRLVILMQKSQVDAAAKVGVYFLSILSITLILFVLIVVSKYVNHFVRPLKSISEVTGKMADLDFAEKCPPSNLVEIDRLSTSVNEMSDALDGALGELRERNKKLEEDIEQERTLDQLRATFISGVSHELKTPIAIIQGYAEGAGMFMDKNPEKAKEYLGVINDEAVRMNNMVVRLLEITKFESGAYSVNYEDFSVATLAQDWIDRNSEILTQKGIEAVCLIDPTLIGRGDPVILGSVVNNYMSNAVSHADGEKKITVTAEERDDVIRVFVHNTGDNIAQKDIDKIWDSFYRADKAMSRSQGRFGLGLALVASIQHLHGMAYGVENCPDGVRFYFDIAKSEAEESEK